MLSKTVSRWLAGVAVSGALVAAAMPAQAQAPAVTIAIFFTDQTIAADSAGKVDPVIMTSSKPVVLPGATVTYDATDLAGAVELASDSGADECESPSEHVLVCKTVFDIEIGEFGVAGPFNLLIKPASTATTGDTGTLKITVTSTGFAPATHTAKVRIGEGVDLAAGRTTTAKARPGSAFSAPVTVRNTGKTAAEGAAVIFFNDYAIQPAKRYSNCTYIGAALASCRFDTTLAAGKTYTATMAYTLRKDTYAPGSTFGEMSWMTPAELEDFTAYLQHFGHTIGTPGTGPKLSLAAAVAALAGKPQADTDRDNNVGLLEVTVTGRNGADLAAVGDTLSGEVGKVVTAEVGVVDKGPATIDGSRGGEPITRFELTVPTGTSVVKVPDGCGVLRRNGDVGPSQPGARAYLCRTGSFLQVGKPEIFPFELRIDKVVANATGRVKILTKCACPIFTRDLNPRNNTAKILVNPAGGSGGGGGLPVTGSATGAFAAAGALLLAAGGAGYWLTRRRRLRFVV